jgi:nitrous oxide reductase accessory protein NosL
MANEDEWTCWGDAAEPVLEGTEEECKKYVVHPPEESKDRIDLYVTDPEGNDWVYNDNDNWVLEYSILGDK